MLPNANYAPPPRFRRWIRFSFELRCISQRFVDAEMYFSSPFRSRNRVTPSANWFWGGGVRHQRPQGNSKHPLPLGVFWFSWNSSYRCPLCKTIFYKNGSNLISLSLSLWDIKIDGYGVSSLGCGSLVTMEIEKALSFPWGEISCFSI